MPLNNSVDMVTFSDRMNNNDMQAIFAKDEPQVQQSSYQRLNQFGPVMVTDNSQRVINVVTSQPSSQHSRQLSQNDALQDKIEASMQVLMNQAMRYTFKHGMNEESDMI